MISFLQDTMLLDLDLPLRSRRIQDSSPQYGNSENRNLGAGNQNPRVEMVTYSTHHI